MSQDPGIDAERAVLGSILIDGSALATIRDLLAPGDFSQDSHARIYRAILDLDARSSAVDLVTLLAAIDNGNGALERIGGPAYLASLVDGIPDVANVEHYAGIVKERALRRELSEVSQNAQRYILEGLPLAEVARNTADRLARISDQIDSAAVGGGEALTWSFDEFMAIEAPEDPMLMEGLFPRQGLGIFAGEAYVGKTLAAIGWTVALASGTPWFGRRVGQAVPCLFVECEGSKYTFRDRFRTAAASLGYSSGLPIRFAKTTEGLTAAAPRLRQMVRDTGARFVVLDPLGYVFRGDENSSKEFKEQVVFPLNRLAAEFGCFFLMLHHFVKASENRSGGQRTRGTSSMRDLVYTHITLENARGGEGRVLMNFDKVKDHEKPSPEVFILDGPRAVLEATGEDAATFLNPRIGEVQRIVLDRGRLRTAELKQSLQDSYKLGSTQAENLISSALAAGVISRPERGWYAPPGNLLGTAPVPFPGSPASIEAAGETGEVGRTPVFPKPGNSGGTGEAERVTL